MKKYFYLLKINLSLISTYRSDLIFGWIYRFLQLFVVYTLWSVTQTSEQDLKKLLLYFLLFYLIFDSLQPARVARWMSKEIIDGTISSFLVKPINYPLVLWMKQTGQVLARLIIPIFIFIAMAIWDPVAYAPKSSLNFIVFIILTILSVLLWNLFITVIGSLSFWLNEISQLQNSINLVLNIFIGRYIPVYLFPESVKYIISLTPANYFGNFQILIYQGLLPREEIINGTIIMTIWTIIFLFISKFIYNRGLKVYEASGN
jgi:ABC-2 type transport system permease protein